MAIWIRTRLRVHHCGDEGCVWIRFEAASDEEDCVWIRIEPCTPIRIEGCAYSCAPIRIRIGLCITCASRSASDLHVD